MHPFLYRFMPSPAAGTPRNLGGGKIPNPYQSLKAAMKLLIFLRF
jgi:hypothetical protein